MWVSSSSCSVFCCKERPHVGQFKFLLCILLQRKDSCGSVQVPALVFCCKERPHVGQFKFLLCVLLHRKASCGSVQVPALCSAAKKGLMWVSSSSCSVFCCKERPHVGQFKFLLCVLLQRKASCGSVQVPAICSAAKKGLIWVSSSSCSVFCCKERPHVGQFKFLLCVLLQRKASCGSISQHATMQGNNPIRILGVASVKKWLPSHVEYCLLDIPCWSHWGQTNLRKSQTNTFQNLDQDGTTFYNVAQTTWKIFQCEQPVHYGKT